MRKTSYNLSSNKRSVNLSEDQLNRKLLKTLLAIVGLIILLVSMLTLFAPEVGSFFGLFSKHRGEGYEQAHIKPNPPIFSFIPNSTKEEEISITGYSQPGLTVKLFVNGPERESTTTGADGLFAFNAIKLNAGSNTISGKTYDAYGSESDSSSVYQVIVDKDKPKIKIDSPKNNETIKNLDGRIRVTGSINEKGNIKINKKTAIVKPDLTFEFLLGVSEGNVQIEIEATDEANNSITEKFNVVYQKTSN